MPICHHFAPNGEKSILYQQLEDKYGADKAHDVWTAIRTQQFLNKEGDWLKLYNKLKGSPDQFNLAGLDSNGELKLKRVEDALNLKKSSFKPANKEQSDAITGIRDFIQNGNADTYFTVAGKAGTGKTTIVQEAIAPFVEQGKNVLVAALSHKAKLVLANKLEDRFGSGPIVSKSIAGALAMGMDMETGKFSTEFGNEYAVPPIAKADIIIVDEASMVNEEALSLILSKKKPSAKLIFLGDIGQLPPIREKGDSNQGKPSPVFGTNNSDTARLVTRVRQGEESPILPYADLFWDNSQSKSPVENPAKAANRKDIVNDKGALVFVDSVNSTLPKVLPLYKEGIENNNPNLVKIVLYRNDPRRMVNRAVREYVFENNAKQQFLPKELIIFTDNHPVEGLNEPISNSTEVQVSSAEQFTTKEGLKAWNLEFGYEGKPVTITTLDDSSKPAHEKLVSDLFAVAKGLPKGQARNKALKEAWTEKRKYAPIDYAYAITSHKSQGSTYNTVVVVENDIMGVGPIGAKEKSQSIYTALTRASTTTIVVDGQKTNQENLDKAIALSHSKIAQPVQVSDDVTVPNQTTEVPQEVTLPAQPVATPALEVQQAPVDVVPTLSTPVTNKPDTSKMKVVPFNMEPSDKKNNSNRETEEVVLGKIAQLYTDAIANPNNLYKVDYKFTSSKYRFNSGYTAKELADMFDQQSIPANIQFDPSFYKLIQNSSKRIIDQFGISVPELINRDDEAIRIQASKILLPKIGDNGQVEGFFTPSQYKDIVDTMTYVVLGTLEKDSAKHINSIVDAFQSSYNSGLRHRQNGTNPLIADTLLYIHNSRVRLADNVMDRLKDYSWKIPDETRAKVLKAVEGFTKLSEQDKQMGADDGTIANVQETVDENGEIIEQAGHGLQDYGDSTFELDPKDTASSRMKSFFAKLPEVDRELKPILNFFGLPKRVDFEQTFEDALNILADHTTGKYKDMIKDLQQSGKPNLVNLSNEMAKQDEQMHNEFTKVMNKQYQQFVMVLFNRVKGKDGKDSYTLNPQTANRYSQYKTILNEWKENQKLAPIMITDGTNQRVIDVKRVQEKWIPWLERTQQIKDWTDTKTLDSVKKYVKSIFSISGISFTDPMMDYLFKNIEMLTKGTSVAGGLAKQFSVNSKGEPEGIFSAFILKSAGKSNAHDVVSDEDAIKRAESNNPLFTENTSMNILTRVAAKFTPKLYSATHKSSEGKNVWDYGQNTKLSHKFRNMLNNFDGFKDLMVETDIARDNFHLTAFINDPKKLLNTKLFYLDGLKPTWGNRGTTRQDMSDREQMLTSIALFQNQNRSTAHFISLTHSDKTTTPVFYNFPKLSIISHPRYLGFDEKGNALTNSAIGDANAPLFNVFKPEWNRIYRKDTEFNNRQYNTGKNLFYFIPEFNYDSMKAMVANGTITQKEMNSIWVNGERNITRSINDDRELKVINKILTLVTQRRVDNTIATWKKMGIIAEDGTTVFDKKYLDGLAKRVGLRTVTTYNSITGTSTGLDSRDLSDLIKAAAQDYSINYFLFNTTASQLFYGDPALAYKVKGNPGDMQKVAGTMKEYAKRLAKDIAPGQDPAWADNKKTYNSITLADVKPNEDYLHNVSKELGEAYKEVEATDAQEVTTVQEHLDVAYAMGLVPTKVYNEMSEIISKANGGYYEFTVPEHLKVIMQPMKPVYSGTRKDVTAGVLQEDYVKTSSYPLYPPLTAGTEMEGLRTMMEKVNIQRAAYVSGKKMGVPVTPLEVFDKKGKFTNPSAEAIQSAQQQLHRDGFRIQQEVPYDEEKEAIKIVSQMNKLINEGIAGIEGFDFGGTKLNGSEVRALKEDIRKQMISNNLKDFMKKLDVKKRDGTYQMNKDKVLDILAEEARKKGYTLNELQGLLSKAEDGTLSIPLMFNTAADRFESLLMSMVKKITEVKMPGKSYVQASSIGLTTREQFRKLGELTQEQKRGIVYVDGYNGAALKTLRIEDGIVKPAQVLAPFNFFDNEGNRLKVEDFLIPGTRTLDYTKIPKELLQLVGARIPNQGHNSMLPIEIVGFIPSNMGDLIVVPSGITKQMGADFDVDKLYTYKRPYFYNDDTQAFEGYAHSEDGVGTKEGLQTQYFDIHWSVLIHPEMVEKVLRPLDKPDLADENKLLASSVGTTDYYDVLSQQQDFQSGKDAKTLVGSTSLSVTFNSVIQNKDLYLYHLGDDGETVRDYVTVLDEDGTKLELTNLSGNGTSMYEGKIRTKADNLTTMQSAAVDNAKDRTLDNLNLTTNTYKAAAAFVQLETEDGKAVNLKYITRLLTQPIIREYDALMKSGNDTLSEEFSKDLSASVVEQLRTKYGTENEEPVIFSPDSLLKSGRNGTNQIAALELFLQLDRIGQRLVELQSLANGDTNGAGANLLSSLDREDKMSRIDQEPIANASQIFDGTEQGTIFNSTTAIANRIVTKLLPYNKLQPIIDRIKELGVKPRLTIDQQTKIVRSLRSFVYTSGEHWWANSQQDRVRLFYNSANNQSLAQRLMQAKRTWGKDNYFLQRLAPVIGSTTTSPDFVEYQAATVGTIDEQQNDRSWVELLISGETEQRQLGEDLLRYAFLTGGIQDANSFVKFIPVSYLANTSFGDMLRAREKAINEYGQDGNYNDTTFEGFTKQFFQHNPDMAVQVGQSVFGTLSEGQDYPESFKIPDSEDPNFPAILKANDGTPVNFISYRNKAEGNKYMLFQKQEIGDSTYYTRIDTLGNQYTDEYDGNSSSGIRSVFTENRSMAKSVGISLTNNSFKSFFNGTSDYEKAGIKEGDGQTIYESLLTIAADNTLQEHLRTVADIFGSIGHSIEVQDAIFKPVELKVKFDRKMENSGSYNSDGTITLNPNLTKDKNDAAETFLHELAHARLQGIIGMAGFDTRVFDNINNLPTDDKNKWLDRIRKFSDKYPEVVKHLETLENVRYEALNHFRNQFGEERYQRALNGLGSERDQRLIYAFSTLQEFVAHVMSNKDVAEYLNGIQSKRGKTILDRIWNLLTDLLESFAKAIGIKVKEGSLFKEALAHTLKLTTLDVSRDVNITNALTLQTTLVVPTEAEAKELQSLGQETYNRVSTATTDGVSWNVNLTNNRIDTKQPVSTQVDRVMEKLHQQLEDAGYALSHGTKQQRIAATIRYRDLKEDIAVLQREKNLDLIDSIGTKQMAWVDKVLATDHPLAVDVDNAIRVVDMWSNLIELLYGDLKSVTSTDPRFGLLSQAAAERRISLLNSKSREVVVDALTKRVTLTDMDFKQKLQEIDAGTANFLTLSRVKPKLIQGIAVLGRQAANNRDEEIGRVRDKLVDLEARMKKEGITPEMFIQNDTWGLVNRLSGKWYSHLGDLKSKLDSSLETIEKSDKDTEAVRKTKKTDAWSKYWNEIKKSAVFVDTRVFFNFETGEALVGTKVDEAFKKLTEAVGSEDYARELVDKAKDKFASYIEEREVAKELIAAMDTTEEAKKEEYEKWKHYNSPVDFLNKMTQKGDVKFVNSGDKWLVMVPKKESTEFYDDKFKMIYGLDEFMGRKKDDTVKIYEEYKALLQEMKSYLPLTEQQDLREDFLPIVSKETVLSLSGIIGAIKNWDNAVMNSLTATEQEELYRLKGDRMPVLYTRSSKRTEEMGDRSTDLIRLMEVFSMMALHHKHLGRVVDTISVAESIIKEENRSRIANDEKGLRNAMDSVKYFIDKLIYKKPAELEGKIDLPIYGAKHFQIQAKFKELMLERTKLEQQVLTNADNGDYNSEDEEKKIEKINEELTKIEDSARYLYASKGVDTIISINQAKALSYNPFSAVSNFTFGLISVSIHANSRVDYDGKSMRWGMSKMMHSTKKYFSFGTAEDNDSVKIMALMDRVGMMGDIVDTEYGKSNLGTRKDGAVVNAIKPYNWQRSGDYFAKGAMMLAMLKHKTVTLSDGTNISLWDAMNDKGVWDTDKYGEAPEWYSEDVSAQTEWNNFRDRIRKVGIMVFGNQDKNAPIMAKKHALLRLAGQFRMSWLAEGIATRFAEEREDVELGRTFKGRWRTYGTLGVGTSGIILCKQLLSSLPFIKVDAFKNATDKKGNPITETDIENMRKNFAGLAWTMAITAAMLMIKGLAFDDDRKQGRKRSGQDAQWQLVLNMVIRNHQDLMLYASPGVFDTITGNLLPATTVLTDTWKALKASGHYIANPDEKNAFDKWLKKQCRAIPIANLYPKTDYMLRRDLDDVAN